MIFNSPTHALRFVLLAAASYPLLACNDVGEEKRQSEQFDQSTVTAVESGEVIVLSWVLRPPSIPGKNATGFIVGDGTRDDGTVGELAFLAQRCSDGRQVWLRSALHNPDIVVLPSFQALKAKGFDIIDRFDDLSVVRCIKGGYSGTFTAELAQSGFNPWTADKSPFSTLYQ